MLKSNNHYWVELLWSLSHHHCWQCLLKSARTGEVPAKITGDRSTNAMESRVVSLVSYDGVGMAVEPLIMVDMGEVLAVEMVRSMGLQVRLA